MITIIIILLLFVSLFEVGRICAHRIFDRYYELLDVRSGELSDNIPDTENLVSDKLSVKVADPSEIVNLDYSAAINHTKRLTFPDKYETDTIDILLLGNDSRGHDYKSRSDAMILLSVNTKEKTATLTSIMRDTMVEIPGYQNHRLNQAFEWGGTELLLETIKENYGIVPDAVAMVNFDAMETIINFFGGIYVTLTEDEIATMNRFYIIELNRLAGEADEKKDLIDVGSVGELQLLNGRQALAYIRVRYTDGYEAGRNARQREVIQLLAQQMKTWDVETADRFAREIFPLIRTNISKELCKQLAAELVYFRDYTIESARIPTEAATLSGDVIRENYFFTIDFDESLQQYQDTVNRKGTYNAKEKSVGFKMLAWLWRKLWQQ